MKKNFMGSIALATFVLTIVLFQMTGCKKDTVQATTATCDVRGTYTGSNLSSTGATSPIIYTLQDNNFAVGRTTSGSVAVTFGGYKNTCDSVILSVYYTGNSSYYLLQGKLTGTTISGTFKNLTTVSDYGTFSITK